MPRFDFFLAHASPDKAQVRPLHRALRALGRTCFLDEADLLPGDEWDIEIPRALADSAVTVVCVSPHFTAAWFQRAEIQRAIALRRKGSVHRVVPVWLEGLHNGGAGTPYGLEVLHGLDAQALGMEEVARRLVGLPAVATPPPAAPPPPAGSAAPPAGPSAPPADPLVLFAALCGLLDGQWARMMMDPRLCDAEPFLPERGARSERSATLLRWVDTQGASTQAALAAVLRSIAPGLMGNG